MSRDTKAMQDDDTANPGMLWVLDGEACGSARPAPPDKACADCHGDARTSMKGVAARYPAFDEARGRPVNLEQRINLVPQQAPAGDAVRLREPRAAGAHRLCRAAVARRADRRRDDARSRRSSTKGARAVLQRQGQLNLACAKCHDDNWGKQLAGNAIPQAHPTGYPIYRLEWQVAGLTAAAAARLYDRDPRRAL